MNLQYTPENKLQDLLNTYTKRVQNKHLSKNSKRVQANIIALKEIRAEMDKRGIIPLNTI